MVNFYQATITVNLPPDLQRRVDAATAQGEEAEHAAVSKIGDEIRSILHLPFVAIEKQLEHLGYQVGIEQ